MTKSKGLLIALTIFVTGAAVGAVGLEAWRAYRGGFFGNKERMSPSAFIVDRMSAELSLSGEQRAKLQPIIDEMIVKLDEARKPCRQEDEELFDLYQGKLRALLTPEQAKRHDEMIARIKKHREMGPPPGGPHGPPPSLFGMPPGPPPGPPPN